MKVEGAENLPDEACIVVGNHSQMNGPLSGEFYFPGKRKIWCAHQMMYLKEVPAYAFQDFWSQKPRWTHWYFRLVSYLITPLSVCVFNNANTIPVYHDMRLMNTFRTTLEALQALAKTPVTRENWRLIAAQLDILQIPGKQDIIADWERTFTQIPEPELPEEVTDYGGPGFMGPQ